MKDKKKASERGVMKYNIWMLRRVWKYTPGYVIGMIVEGILWGIHHSISIFFSKVLLDSLGEGAEFNYIAKIILWYGAYMLLFYVFNYWYWWLYNPKLREKLHLAMHAEMFSHAVAMDIAKYDDPKFYNDFVWAMEKSHSHAFGLLEDTGKLINRIISLVTLIGILFATDVTMAIIIILVAVVRTFIMKYRNKINLKHNDEANPLHRKSNYIQRVFKMPDYAKELRTTAVYDNLMQMYEENIKAEILVQRKYATKTSVSSGVLVSLGMLSDSGILILLLYKMMVLGTVAFGAFAVAVNSAWKLAWTMRDMTDRIMKYHEHGIYIEKVVEFLEYEPTVKGGSDMAEPMREVELRNVTFSYDGEKNALDAVDMHIKKGEKIAIVGYNGAGKTTLTKLLMRLYDTTSGEILYNGKPLSNYKIDSLRGRIAAVFQDYRIFAASIAENVVGGKYEDAMEEKLLNALHDSTFDSKLETLEEGIHTQLTREFYNSGTQLSGGESQKIAIARAFFKDADFIILDEPSSALDPDAEYALNQAITEYAKEKTVLFISHRLSTTRGADRIYMFDGGKLIESGTHEELIAMDGKYAYMFNLQAKKYNS